MTYLCRLRRLFSLAIACLMATQALEAAPWDCDADPECPAQEVFWDWNVQLGYRYDELRWSMGIPEIGPNVRSELIWDNLNSPQIAFECLLEYPNLFYMRSNIDYAYALSGKVRDYDYDLNNRQGLLSLATCDASGSQFFDLSVGAGRLFCHPKGYFTIAPLIGYSLHIQRFVFGDGVLRRNNVVEELIMSSHYTALWNSVWVGADMTVPTCTPWEFCLSYELHYALYRATGHWNLRPDFYRDFHHTTDAIGQQASGGASYRITECSNINLTVNLKSWLTFSGIHNMYVTVNNPVQDDGEENDGEGGSGQNDTSNHHTRLCLNRLCWFSLSFMLGFNTTF